VTALHSSLRLLVPACALGLAFFAFAHQPSGEGQSAEKKARISCRRPGKSTARLVFPRSVEALRHARAAAARHRPATRAWTHKHKEIQP